MYRPSVLLASLASSAAVRRCCPWRALAQSLPAGPVSAFDGRLAVGAEVVATVGDRGRRRVFQLHGLRAQHPADVPGGAVGVLAPHQPGRGRRRSPVRGPRIWCGRTRRTSGCVPGSTTRSTCSSDASRRSFGAFGRRGYQGVDNPLIGYPLAYQYLTSLRPDAAPATVADLLVDARPGLAADATPSARRSRGRACRSSPPSAGIPASRATGRGARSTSPAASRPARLPIRASSDNNGGKQVSGRVAYRPTAGLDPRRVGGTR